MFEADHVPAGIVAIAAPGWQRKRANDGVEPDRLEERRLLDGTDDFVLLGGGEFRKRRRPEHVRCPPVQILEPLGVDLLLARVERRERPIDEKDDAGLMRAGTLVDRRNDARRQRVDRFSLSRRKRGEASAWFGRGLLGRPGERVFDRQKIGGRPGGSGGGGGAEERTSTVKIHDASGYSHFGAVHSAPGAGA